MKFLKISMFDSCFLKLFLKIVFENIDNVNYSCFLNFVFFVFSRTKKIREPKVFAVFYVFSWFFKSKNSFQKP